MERLYYSISEMAKMLNVEQGTLRYWEREFPQFTPKRNPKGTRFYTPENLATAKQIYYLRYDQGLSIDGVKLRLKQKGSVVSRNQEVVERLNQLKRDLLEIRKNIK